MMSKRGPFWLTFPVPAPFRRHRLLALVRRHGNCDPKGGLVVLAQDTQDLALNADIRRRRVDGSHFCIRGL